ncbi:MAG: PKD domain-containing protein [Planctomycetota bacterium]|jgi:hypothetical protein
MKRLLTICAVVAFVLTINGPAQAVWYIIQFSEEDLWNHTTSSDERLYNQDAPRRHHTAWKSDVQTTDSTQPNQNQYQSTLGLGTNGWYQTATYDSWLVVGPKDNSDNDFGICEVQLWGAGWPNVRLTFNERFQVNEGPGAWKILATPAGWSGVIVDNPWDNDGAGAPPDQYWIVWTADAYANRILSTSVDGVDDYIFKFAVDIIGEYPTTLEPTPDGDPLEASGDLRFWFGGNVLYPDDTWNLAEGYDGVMTKSVCSPSVIINGLTALLSVIVPVDSSVVFEADIGDDCGTAEGVWDFGDSHGYTESPYSAEHSYNAVGIYTVTLEVTDILGNTDTETLMVVVYDPEGGFVTGGGWIDSPEGAYVFPTDLVWNQGFENDTSGWYDSSSEWYGNITRVPSGTDSISSASGSYHAIFSGDESSAPFSRFDQYRDTWTGTYIASISVYLDPSWASGQGFDYSVAATGSDGYHQRDYIFHVTKDTSTGKLLVAGSNNTNFAPREDLENINHYEVTSAGWHTLEHIFYEQSGALAVDLNLLNSGGNILFTETRFNSGDVIPDEVGGNRYAWFTFINVESGIAVDDHMLEVSPPMPTGKASFGFVSKYKKGASVPTGNTEFVFQAADLNFHSNSYQWLVVNQGGTNAQFKGSGTINGDGSYKFMLWARDDEPDTFRIKIWDEVDDTEYIVYDNGFDQAIEGGNIVIHTSKSKN